MAARAPTSKFANHSSDHFFAKLVRAVREHFELTQSALAHLCDVTQPAVAHWETGASPIQESTLEKIAWALDMTVEELVRAGLAAIDKERKSSAGSARPRQKGK